LNLIRIMPAQEVTETSRKKLTMMLVYINEHERFVNDNCNIDTLLDLIDIKEKKGIAVAVNYEVIAKEKWNDVCLCENDKIIIIKATRGG